MIKFKAKDLILHSYTSTLIGNDGEEQLILVVSWGQDRACSLIIVGARCDDSVRVLYDSKKKRLNSMTFLTKVKQTVDAWSTSGTKPTAEEEKKRVKQTRKLMDLLSIQWGIGN